MNYPYPTQPYPSGLYKLFRQETGMTAPMTSSMIPPMAAAGPFAPAAGFNDIFAEEKLSFEDARKLQSFYPRVAQEIQRHVEEECDKMEYEGSMMFDEYPDRLMIRRIADNIGEKMKDFSVEEALKNPVSMEEEELSMQSEGRRRPFGNDGLGDFIQVMLLDEMHRRRCRHRRCRNRRFW